MVKMINSSSTPKVVQKSRQQPPRSRRGGLGVASSEVDIMILDMLQRRFENEPLIPADTQFLLTTNSSLAISSSSSSSSSSSNKLQINIHANDRYFDRPEVLKAYREQQIIETPEFTLLSEVASVGSRFRPRGSEDQDSADTSDALYERRHRKFEALEKRQRRHEKEKLVNEQRKLRERIEQLRAMDAAAFLVVPASSFPLGPGQTQSETDVLDLSSVRVNGAAVHNEGERRRKDMLDVAIMLEERYTTLLLLPPGDKRGRGSGSVSVEPEPSDTSAHWKVPEPPRKEIEKLKLMIKFPPSASGSQQGQVQPAPVTRSPLTRRAAAHVAIPASPLSSSIIPDWDREDEEFVTGRKDYRHNSIDWDDARSEFTMESPAHKRPRRARTPASDKEYEDGSVSPTVSRSAAPYSPTTSKAKQHVSYAGAAGKAERTTCLLMVSALRNSSVPTARKTQRHITAFGTKVPPEIEEVRDFDLPYWLHEWNTRTRIPAKRRGVRMQDRFPAYENSVGDPEEGDVTVPSEEHLENDSDIEIIDVDKNS